MSDLFQKLIEMSVMGSIVILITLLMRFFLRKSSKRYMMILWAVVALRLLVPVSIESSLSIFNFIPYKTAVFSVSGEAEKTDAASAIKAPVANDNELAEINSVEQLSNDLLENKLPSNAAPAVATTEMAANAITANAEATNAGASNEVITNEAAISETPANAMAADAVATNGVAADAVAADEVAANDNTKAKDSSSGVKVDYKTTVAIVWATGFIGILIYCIVRFFMLKIKLKDATRVEKNIYESEKVPSPFVFGFIVPRIYLPDVLDKTEREYMLMHEQTHIKHGDWISKIVGMVVVAVHWFNPLVWLAYAFFEQDMEMHCDERTISDMDVSLKQAYTMSIVSYARKSNSKRYLVTPLGFSKVNFSKMEVTSRVKNICSYKKGTKITALITTVMIVAVSSACALNSKSEMTNNKNSETADQVSSDEIVETDEITVDNTTHAGNKPDADADVIDGSYAAIDIDWSKYSYEEDDFDSIRNYNYDVIRAAATELHEQYPSMFFGFGTEYDLFNADNSRFEYQLITYEETIGYKAYRIKDSKLVENDWFSQNLTPDMSEQQWLLNYDQFMDLPITASYFSLGYYDTNTYDETLPDGQYHGTIEGFSADGKYAYMLVFSRIDVNLTPEECLNLVEGDTAELSNGNYVVLNTTTDGNRDNAFRINLSNDKGEGAFILVYQDEEGNPTGKCVFDGNGYLMYEQFGARKIAISDNCVIDDYLNGFDNLATYNASALKGHLDELVSETDADYYCKLTNGGYYMEILTGYSNNTKITPTIIENGEITYMNFCARN